MGERRLEQGRHRTWSIGERCRPSGPRRRQRRRSATTTRHLARQRPDNETQETHSGYVGTDRRRPVWRVGGDARRVRGRGQARWGAGPRRSRASCAPRRSAASRTTCSCDSSQSRGLDFRNDTEVHVIARGKSEQTGLEYGATIEFEADTNSTLNTDETWIFLRGGWGELRMGDEDGVVDNSVVGGQTIAAGTGGIDGSDAVIIGGAGGVPDQHQRRDQDPLLHAELRRLQPRRVATRRRRRTSTAAPTTAGLRQQEWRPGLGGMDAKNIVEGAAGL